MDSLEFGKYLRLKREDMNLSMGQLARLAGVSQPYISQIEKGVRGVPSPDILGKLAEPLGVRYEILMSKAGYVDSSALKIDRLTHSASVIINTILDITLDIKDKYHNSTKSRTQYIELFEDKLKKCVEKDGVLVDDLLKMLWRLEGDGDSYEPLIGNRREASQIEGLLRALSEIIVTETELNIRQIYSGAIKSITEYLKQHDITYNGHTLTDQDRKRILDILKVLFPDYQE